MKSVDELKAAIVHGRRNKTQDVLFHAFGSSYRRDGKEVPTTELVVDRGLVDQFCKRYLDDERSDTWQSVVARDGGLDFVAVDDDFERIRVHVGTSHRRPYLAIRYLNDRIYRPEELGLPPVLLEWCRRSHGAIVLGGLMGSGKTCATASLSLMLANAGRRVKEINDPTEYEQRHPLILQTEIGTDVPDASSAIFGSKREAHDVVFFGEIRDAIAARAFLRAAETGMLVIGTTHLSDMASSSEAFEAYFEPNERYLFRTMYSRQLIGGLGMTLVPKARVEPGDEFGRVLATEILVNNEAIANNIRSGAPPIDIRQLMRQTASPDMRTMEQHLSTLHNDGIIGTSDAYAAAVYTDDLHLASAA